MKKVLLLVIICALLLFSACDTELGHTDEDHDHDGDGVQDHAAEDHVDEDHEEDDHDDEMIDDHSG